MFWLLVFVLLCIRHQACWGSDRMWRSTGGAAQRRVGHCLWWRISRCRCHCCLPLALSWVNSFK